MNSNRLICNICLEPTSIVQHTKRKVKPRDSNDTILKCTHIFHRACIKKWYVSSPITFGNSCPCCRTNIRFKEGNYYNKLLLYYVIRQHYNEYNFDDFEYANIIRYVYHDNAILILFVNDVWLLLTHFCLFCWLMSMEKDTQHIQRKCI